MCCWFRTCLSYATSESAPPGLHAPPPLKDMERTIVNVPHNRNSCYLLVSDSQVLHLARCGRLGCRRKRCRLRPNRGLDTLAETDREALILEINRVIALADEPGQNALQDVVTNRAVFDTVDGGHNHALWVLMNEPQNFRLAEEVRYNDEKRRGRMWAGYVVEKKKLVRKDQFSRDAFIAEIQKKFSTNHVHVDVFDRHRVTFDGKSHQLVQVAVYREGRSDDALGFDGAGKLQRHLVKPVYEASHTYEPSEGVIEVVASDKDTREAMAGFMGRHLLDIHFKGERLSARQYDLSSGR